METTKTFYLTFGQKYPWRNGWVEVKGFTKEEARKMVIEIFGTAWADLRDEEHFDSSYFPAGKLGETIE